jgi:hypothetical protein
VYTWLPPFNATSFFTIGGVVCFLGTLLALVLLVYGVDRIVEPNLRDTLKLKMQGVIQPARTTA